LALAAPLAAFADPSSGIQPSVHESVSPGVDSGVSGGDCALLQAQLAQDLEQDQAAGAAVGVAVETLAGAQTSQPGSSAVKLAQGILLLQQQRRTDAAQTLDQARQRVAAAHCG
jgi:hypothetical protein